MTGSELLTWILFAVLAWLGLVAAALSVMATLTFLFDHAYFIAHAVAHITAR